jgi:hypothetical protein
MFGAIKLSQTNVNVMEKFSKGNQWTMVVRHLGIVSNMRNID